MFLGILSVAKKSIARIGCISGIRIHGSYFIIGMCFTFADGKHISIQYAIAANLNCSQDDRINNPRFLKMTPVSDWSLFLRKTDKETVPPPSLRYFRVMVADVPRYAKLVGTAAAIIPPINVLQRRLFRAALG